MFRFLSPVLFAIATLITTIAFAQPTPDAPLPRRPGHTDSAGRHAERTVEARPCFAETGPQRRHAEPGLTIPGLSVNGLPGQGFTIATSDGRYSLNLRLRFQFRDTARTANVWQNQINLKTFRFIASGHLLSPEHRVLPATRLRWRRLRNDDPDHHDARDLQDDRDERRHRALPEHHDDHEHDEPQPHL